MAVIVNNDTVIEMLAAIPQTKNRRRQICHRPENGDQINTDSNLNKTNAEITCNQIAEQYLGSLTKGNFIVKGL